MCVKLFFPATAGLWYKFVEFRESIHVVVLHFNVYLLLGNLQVLINSKCKYVDD